jgi:hypothetical protein
LRSKRERRSSRKRKKRSRRIRTLTILRCFNYNRPLQGRREPRELLLKKELLRRVQRKVAKRREVKKDLMMRI